MVSDSFGIAKIEEIKIVPKKRTLEFYEKYCEIHRWHVSAQAFLLGPQTIYIYLTSQINPTSKNRTL
jgi:hypothetical protein